MISFKKIGVLACVAFFQFISAQEKKDSLIVPFRLKFGNELLALNKMYILKDNDTLEISTLKFYVSAIEIHYADASFSRSERFHLLDMESPQTLGVSFPYSGKSISKISFCIGVDSLASVSGAMAGDLDPVNGMYWAWQSGYINMKIEGRSPSCKTRKNEFQFHIGGYLKPHNAMRMVSLEVRSLKPEITVDLARLFSKIRLADTNSIMIPGTKAMGMADVSVNMFLVE